MSYIPTAKDEDRLARTLQKLRENLKGLTLIDVGSTAKGTWLSGESDIDIYVICDNKYLTHRKVKELYPKGHDKKGQLTIWNFQLDGFDVDLVLVNKDFKKREDTTKHTAFFNEHLTNEERYEVRRMKAYLKTKGVYGAEIGGIVGVAVEELMRQNGSMLNTIKFLWENRKQLPYIQDPTMNEERNLLASINGRRWNQICEACRLYLLDQNFKYELMTTDEFVEQYKLTHCLMMFHRKFDKGLDYQTITSTAYKIRRILHNKESREIKISIDAYVDNDRIVLCYRVRPLELSPTKEVCVEPQYAKGFKDAHPDAYVKDGKTCVIVKRKVIFPDTFFTTQVANLMKEKGFKRF